LAAQRLSFWNRQGTEQRFTIVQARRRTVPIRLANSPVSWGIFEFEAIEKKYPYSQVLDEIAATGYNGLELGTYGYLPTDPDRLRSELDRRGLQLLSAYVPVKLVDAQTHEAGEQIALMVGQLLAKLGAKNIVLADDNGTVPALIAQAGRVTKVRLSPDQWDVVARGVNRIARKIHDELGLKVVFHHHIAGYVETADETRELMSRTDGDLVGLCLDTGHWTYAGGDTLACVREYGERIRYLHLKDCDPVIAQKCRDQGLDYFQATKAGIFCELGRGTVDFPGVFAAMEKLGYDGWAVVEQDVLIDDLDAPKQSAQRNREYLAKIGTGTNGAQEQA
jgi:inosose dehydratase